MASMLRSIRRNINRNRYGKRHSGGYSTLSKEDKKVERLQRIKEYRQYKAKMKRRRRRKMFQRVRT